MRQKWVNGMLYEFPIPYIMPHGVLTMDEWEIIDSTLYWNIYEEKSTKNFEKHAGVFILDSFLFSVKRFCRKGIPNGHRAMVCNIFL